MLSSRTSAAAAGTKKIDRTCWEDIDQKVSESKSNVDLRRCYCANRTNKCRHFEASIAINFQQDLRLSYDLNLVNQLRNNPDLHHRTIVFDSLSHAITITPIIDELTSLLKVSSLRFEY